MIPLKDSRRSPGIAWGTWALVAANLLVFVWELRLGAGLAGAIARIALSPAEDWSGAFLELAAPACRVSSPRSSCTAAGSTCSATWRSSPSSATTSRAGSGGRRFLLLYLGSGLVASSRRSPPARVPPCPLLGASGAIAGVLGAFLVLFPKARLAGVLPLGCLVIPMKSRAFLFIPFWFLLQLFGALTAPPGSLVGGVAWYAHLAGFAAGPVLLFLLRRR